MVPQFQYLTEDRAQRLMDNTLLLQRRYSGEMKQGGVIEYAMASRRYLSLLFMGLSSFGAALLLPALAGDHDSGDVPGADDRRFAGGQLSQEGERRGRDEGARKGARDDAVGVQAHLRRSAARAGRAFCNSTCRSRRRTRWPARKAHCATSRAGSRRTASDEKQRIQRQMQNLETTEKKLQLAAKGRETIGKAIKHHARRAEAAGTEPAEAARGCTRCDYRGEHVYPRVR